MLRRAAGGTVPESLARIPMVWDVFTAPLSTPTENFMVFENCDFVLCRLSHTSHRTGVMIDIIHNKLQFIISFVHSPAFQLSCLLYQD